MCRRTIIVMVAAAVATIAGTATVVFLGTFSWRGFRETPGQRQEASDMAVNALFSSDYRTARGRFLAAAADAGAQVENLENPHAGPDGQGIFTDVALLGPRDARTIIVLSSGTHGVEGFAGSGIQMGLLREGIASRLPSGVALVMIHAINPFGMAHLRRFNEDNVDVNRNFRDHSVPPPRNADYEALATVIAPRSMSFWSEVRSWSRILWYRLTKGIKASQAAVQGGQYTHPNGLFYGGSFEVWSNQTIRTIAERYLSGTHRVVVVDVHTGLGESGNAEIILNDSVTAPNYRRAVAIWGDSMVRSTIGGASVSAHLDASLKRGFAKILPNVEMTAVSLEFGTLPTMDVFRALRAENWLHHHGSTEHPRAQLIKTRLLRAFHPDDAGWEDRVWSVGAKVVQQALAWAGEQESNGGR